MLDFLNKFKHFLNRKIFKNLKYEFEEFIPNSLSDSRTTHNLIKININQFSKNLSSIHNFFEKFEIINLDSLHINHSFNEKIKQMFEKHGSDKSKHGYHLLYSNIFERLPINPTILEIGLGTTNSLIPSNMGEKGIPGASLFALSEIYPNSEIFGADIDINILMNFNNVKSFYLDQNNFKTYNNKLIEGKEFDLIIDDGLHMQSANLNTLRFALERLKPGGILVIEDISSSALNTWNIVRGLLRNPYTLTMYECFDNYAVSVELKN